MKYKARTTTDLFFPLPVNSISIPNTGINTAITTKKRPVISCGASLEAPSNVTAQRTIHNKPVAGPISLSNKEGSSSIQYNFQIKGKKCTEICGRLKNVHIFTSLNYVNGAADCPKNSGLFYFSPLQYGGGYLRGRRTPSPVDGFSSVSATAFLLAQNLNIIAMLSKSTGAIGTTLGALSPEEILNDVIHSDDPQRLRQHLRCMADAYLLTEDEAGYRHSVFATYMVLDAMLSKIEKLIPNTVAA
jgi:hypothetical protein